MEKTVSLPPTSIFMRECWQSDRNRCLIGRKLTVRRLPVAVKRYSHQKKNLLSNSTLSRAQPAPKATLMHILFIVRPSCTPRPPPGRGSAPYGHWLLVTHRFTFTRSEAKIITKTFDHCTALPETARSTNTHGSGICCGGCGLGACTAAARAPGAHLSAPAHH